MKMIMLAGAALLSFTSISGTGFAQEMPAPDSPPPGDAMKPPAEPAMPAPPPAADPAMPPSAAGPAPPPPAAGPALLPPAASGGLVHVLPQQALVPLAAAA